MVQYGPNGRKWSKWSKMVRNGGPDLKRAQRTGLSARRARRTKSSRPEGPKAGPKGRYLEVGARRAPRLLVHYNRQNFRPVQINWWNKIIWSNFLWLHVKHDLCEEMYVRIYFDMFGCILIYWNVYLEQPCNKKCDTWFYVMCDLCKEMHI